ncbi:MAG: hypothetical protein ACXAC5_03480 [Promethearchaeota archaeon]
MRNDLPQSRINKHRKPKCTKDYHSPSRLTSMVQHCGQTNKHGQCELKRHPQHKLHRCKYPSVVDRQDKLVALLVAPVFVLATVRTHEADRAYAEAIHCIPHKQESSRPF